MDKKYKTLGIICKTRKQAQLLDAELKSMFYTCLLTNESISFSSGLIITFSHMPGGLEFDEVIVPFASADNYSGKIDKRMLYVACTSAMHRLTVTCVKEKSPFLM